MGYGKGIILLDDNLSIRIKEYKQMAERNWTQIFGVFLLLTGGISLVRQDWLTSAANIGFGVSLLMHPTAEAMPQRPWQTRIARLLALAAVVAVVLVLVQDLAL